MGEQMTSSHVCTEILGQEVEQLPGGHEPGGHEPESRTDGVTQRELFADPGQDWAPSRAPMAFRRADWP